MNLKFYEKIGAARKFVCIDCDEIYKILLILIFMYKILLILIKLYLLCNILTFRELGYLSK